MDTKLVSHVGTEPEFVHVETQTLNTKSQTPVPRFCQNLTAQACFVMSAGKSRGCCSSWPSHLDIIFCWLVLVCGSACSFATIALMPKCPIQSSAAAQVQQVQPVLMPQLDGAAVWTESTAQSQGSHWRPWAEFGSPGDMCELISTDVAAVDLADATAVDLADVAAVPTQQAVLTPSEIVEEHGEIHEVVAQSALAKHKADQGVATAVASGGAAPTSADNNAVTPAVASVEEARFVLVESATEGALCSLAAAMHASTGQTTAVAAADCEATELMQGIPPPENHVYSQFHAADRALQAPATAEVAVEVEVAEVDTADMHRDAAVGFDLHSSTEPGLSVPAAPAELHAVLAATAAALPAAAAVAGAEATPSTVAGGAELYVVSAVAGVDAALSSAAGGVVPADTPVATDGMSAYTESVTQKDEAATLSGSVTVESPADTDHTAAEVQPHEGQASGFWGQHPDKTVSPSCLSPSTVDIMLSSSCASPNTVDIMLTTGEGRSVAANAAASSAGPVQVAAAEEAHARLAAELAAIFAWVGNELPKTPTEPSQTFTEHRPEGGDAKSFSAGDSQNARMAAELAAIFALADPQLQQSLAEPSSEASAAADSVVADSVVADSVIADSVVANRAAISLPLENACRAAAEDAISFCDAQPAEDLPAEHSSLTAPVTSDEDSVLTEAAGELQITLHHTPEDVSIYNPFCPGMDVSSDAVAPCITEQYIMTAAAFPQTPQIPCDTESFRRAGGGIAAETVGKVIARAYSHHTVAGELFSPMVLLGTPDLTLLGMSPPEHPPHKMSFWLP